MPAPTIFARPLSIGDMLDWSIRIYRARFGKLMLTTAIFFVPIGLVSGLITGQTMTGYLNIFLAAMQNPDVVLDERALGTLSNQEGMLTSLSCLLMPLSLLATGIVSLALVHQVISTIRNEEATIKESLHLGWQRFWSWLGMHLVMSITFIGVAIALVVLFIIAVVAVVAVFSGIAGASMNSLESGGVAAVSGLLFGVFCFYAIAIMLFFGPFIYLYSRWAVAIPGIVDQRWGAVEALQESWTLTKGHAWRSIGYNLLLMLLYLIIYAALMSLGFGLATFVLTTSTVASAVVFAMIGAILPVLWQPIQIAAQVMLYYDLRMRNESYDLEMRLNQLEAEVRRDEPASL